MNSTKPKPPVLFVHGLVDSADTFIMHNASVAPAFVVARTGYDVWLANSRGNKYCLKHTNPNISKEKFWDFTFEEMGEKDLPPIIDYILNTTRQ